MDVVVLGILGGFTLLVVIERIVAYFQHDQ